MLSQLQPCIKFISSQQNAASLLRIFAESLEDFSICTMQSKSSTNSYEYFDSLHVSMRSQEHVMLPTPLIRPQPQTIQKSDSALRQSLLR